MLSYRSLCGKIASSFGARTGEPCLFLARPCGLKVSVDFSKAIGTSGFGRTILTAGLRDLNIRHIVITGQNHRNIRSTANYLLNKYMIRLP